MVPCVCVYVPPASREGAPRENLLLISWGLLTRVGVSYTVKQTHTQTHSDTHTNTRTCITIYTVHVHVLWFYQKHSHKNLFFYTYTHMYMHTNAHELPDHLKPLNFWGISSLKDTISGPQRKNSSPPWPSIGANDRHLCTLPRKLEVPVRSYQISVNYPFKYFLGSNNKSVSKKCR